MAEKNVLIVVGTLRKNGFNEQLAQRIEALLEGRANVSRLDYSALPLMNQDLEDPERPEVAAVREAVRQADGVWFVSPQYNASFPGRHRRWRGRPHRHRRDARGARLASHLRGRAGHDREGDRHRPLRRVLDHGHAGPLRRGRGRARGTGRRLPRVHRVAQRGRLHTGDSPSLPPGAPGAGRLFVP